ncbi:MAG: ABCB family ABC transporter ATP-binding protein/permease [Hyphomicrobiales bacterium]
MSNTEQPGGGKFPEADGHYETLRGLFPYLWPQERPDLKVRVVVALIALVLSKVVTVVTPFAFRDAVDALSPTETALIVAPIAMILAYGIGRIMMVVTAQIRDGLFAKVGQYAVRHVANRTFKHLHNLSLRFHLERRTGGLTRIIDRGTKGIETILRYSLFNTFPTILELLFVCGILYWNFGFWFAFVTAVTVALYIWFTYAATEWRIAIRRAMNDADTDANTKSVDSMLNFETVKYFGNEQHESKRYDVAMERYEAAANKTWTSLAVLNSGQAVIFHIGMIICMVLAGYGVANGTMTVGDFVMVNTFLIQLYLPLNFLGTVYRDIKQGLIDIESMFNLLDVTPEIEDKPNAQSLKVDQGAVRFEDVHFAYDAERPILKGISFEVPAGKKVAIVGPSGAGKSTISRLLFRFYEVSSGAITMDDQNISDVTQHSLRRAIGMVPQDTVLFNDTILYNIQYGRPGATAEEVIAAAKLAQIHDFIETLPQGYNSMVGERGLKLSGGEKQRVAIARTLLKAPPVLVLDEATSALDTYTEQEIQSALAGVSRDRTTLVIAHRLSTVVDADEIIVLEDGKIAERGTHGVLLEHDGVYADLWNRQLEAEEAQKKLAEAHADRGLSAEDLLLSPQS